MRAAPLVLGCLVIKPLRRSLGLNRNNSARYPPSVPWACSLLINNKVWYTLQSTHFQLLPPRIARATSTLKAYFPIVIVTSNNQHIDRVHRTFFTCPPSPPSEGRYGHPPPGDELCITSADYRSINCNLGRCAGRGHGRREAPCERARAPSNSMAGSGRDPVRPHRARGSGSLRRFATAR